MPLPLPPPLLPHTRIPHTRSSCSKPCSLSPSASAHVHRGSLRLTPSSSSIKTEFWKLLPRVRPSAPWISSLPVSLSPGVLLAFLPMGMGGGQSQHPSSTCTCPREGPSCPHIQRDLQERKAPLFEATHKAAAPERGFLGTARNCTKQRGCAY